MTEIQVAFGLVQLRKMPERLQRLSEIYSIYRETLDNTVMFDDEDPRWYVDIFSVNAPKIRDALKTKRIHCRQYPVPLHMQEVASSFVNSATSFANAETRYKTGLYLPSTTNISNDNARSIALEIVNVLK